MPVELTVKEYEAWDQRGFDSIPSGFGSVLVLGLGEVITKKEVSLGSIPYKLFVWIVEHHGRSMFGRKEITDLYAEATGVKLADPYKIVNDLMKNQILVRIKGSTSKSEKLYLNWELLRTVKVSESLRGNQKSKNSWTFGEEDASLEGDVI